MPDLAFTWGQVKRLADAMGLSDDDPPPSAGMITSFLEAAAVIDAPDAGGRE